MDLLAVETASNVCGLALFLSNGLVRIEEAELEREHAETLPLFFEKLKENHDLSLKNLDGIAVSIGPGSFTGLRIGLGFGKGLAFGGSIPLVPVPTLKAMARGSGKSDGLLRCVLHSHRDYVYFQDFVMLQGYGQKIDSPQLARWGDACLCITESMDICHYGCDGLLGEGSSLRGVHCVPPSAKYVGEISVKEFETLKRMDFQEIEPEYISPFKARVYPPVS